MKRPETTRRSFLGSLAVLAAGAAVSSPVRLFSDPPVISGLQQQWDLFCRRHKGRTFYGKSPDRDEYMLPEVVGHTYKSGRAIYFREIGLLAVPVWIYWGTGKPDDVCITLFEKSSRSESISRKADVYIMNGRKEFALEENGQKVGLLQKADDQTADVDIPEAGSRLRAPDLWRKIRRLNNYELKGLNALSAEVDGGELLAALKAPTAKLRKSGKLSLATRIKKDKVQIKAILSQSQVTLEEKIIYYYG